MNEYLVLYYDGCNGMKRGETISAETDEDGVPIIDDGDGGHLALSERNPGDGIFEDDGGEHYYVELR